MKYRKREVYGLRFKVYCQGKYEMKLIHKFIILQKNIHLYDTFMTERASKNIFLMHQL